MRLQHRRGASRIARVLAAVVGLWLIVGGTLARQHEAQVAHVIDRHTGLVRHAEGACGHDEVGLQTHVHGLPAAGHDDDRAPCVITLALHQAASAAVAPADPIHLPESALALRVLDVDVEITQRSVFRLAPKTSPPCA